MVPLASCLSLTLALPLTLYTVVPLDSCRLTVDAPFEAVEGFATLWYHRRCQRTQRLYTVLYICMIYYILYRSDTILLFCLSQPKAAYYHAPLPFSLSVFNSESKLYFTPVQYMIFKVRYVKHSACLQRFIPRYILAVLYISRVIY